MSWMNKIANCQHEQQDLEIEGIRLQICKLCGSVQGWSEAQQRWLWAGAMTDVIRFMKHKNIMAEMKCKSSETLMAVGRKA